jgi:Protein of unknown function (DUF3102)
MTQELEISLATKINETYAEGLSLAHGAKEQAFLAIKKVIECGQYLIEAKQAVGYGNFRSWLDSHVTTLSSETANRYMRLASTPPEQLKDAYSIRQAYIAAGILDKPGNAPAGQNHDPDGINWINILSKMTVQIERLFDTRPISAWNDVERETFVERAKPIIKRYIEAGGTLNSL